jgi:hypothetical protein
MKTRNPNPAARPAATAMARKALPIDGTGVLLQPANRQVHGEPSYREYTFLTPLHSCVPDPFAFLEQDANPAKIAPRPAASGPRSARLAAVPGSLSSCNVVLLCGAISTSMPQDCIRTALPPANAPVNMPTTAARYVARAPYNGSYLPEGSVPNHSVTLERKSRFYREWRVETAAGTWKVAYEGRGFGWEGILIDNDLVVRRSGHGWMSHQYRFELSGPTIVWVRVAVPWCHEFIFLFGDLSFVQVEVDGEVAYQEGSPPRRVLAITHEPRGFEVANPVSHGNGRRAGK